MRTTPTYINLFSYFYFLAFIFIAFLLRKHLTTDIVFIFGCILKMCVLCGFSALQAATGIVHSQAYFMIFGAKDQILWCALRPSRVIRLCSMQKKRPADLMNENQD